MKRKILPFFAIGWFLLVNLAYAKVVVLDEIVVEGERKADDKGDISIQSEALPTPVHVLTGEEVEKINITHYLDLFRRQPGMITSSYGQGDIADGFGMRGYDSGHGSQIAIFVDGVPVNSPNHSHSHGFNDLGWLTPEMIEKVEVIKGPSSALYGNFALGGVINIITKRRGETAVTGSGGSFGQGRGALVYSGDTPNYSYFSVFEHSQRDGYRANSDYERHNFFSKLTFPLLDGTLSARAHYVNREWGAPGYLDVDDVRNDVVERTDAVNITDGGDSENFNLVLNYSPSKGEKGLFATIYGASEDLNRFATFTGPQRLEHNERLFGGWNILYNYVPMEQLSLTLGTDGRYDYGKRQRFSTEERHILDTQHHWRTTDLNLGLFLQAQVKPVDFLKITGGARYDNFFYDIENKKVRNHSGTGDQSIISPKVGIVISPFKNMGTPVDSLNLFANRAVGFRTAAANELSPSDPDVKDDFGLDPAIVETWDFGFDITLFDRVYLAFDYFFTEMQNELRFVGDEVVNVGDSERIGGEVEGRVYATDELSFYGSCSWVEARIKNPDPKNPGDSWVTGVPEYTATGGISWYQEIINNHFLGIDLSTQVLGDTPIDAAGKHNKKERPAFARYMGKISYEVGDITIFTAATYHPEQYASEAMFGVGFDPKPLWDVNGGITYNF